jgi:hypothetical protein
VLPLRIANRLPTLRRGCSFRQAVMSVMACSQQLRTLAVYAV